MKQIFLLKLAFAPNIFLNHVSACQVGERVTAYWCILDWDRPWLWRWNFVSNIFLRCSNPHPTIHPIQPCPLIAPRCSIRLRRHYISSIYCQMQWYDGHLPATFIVYLSSFLSQLLQYHQSQYNRTGRLHTWWLWPLMKLASIPKMDLVNMLTKQINIVKESFLS